MPNPVTHLLIDFNSLAYYAATRCSHSEDVGEAFNSLLKNASTRWPKSKPFFALDQREGNQFRKRLWPDYKAHRRPTTDLMLVNFKILESQLHTLQHPQETNLEFEADDILASWAKQCKRQKFKALIISNDRDLYQASNDFCGQIRPADIYAGHASSWQDIKRKIGIEPQLLADVKALCGEKSDNIPGVPGIGMHSAIKIIRRFGPVEHLSTKLDTLASMPWRESKTWAQSIAKHIEQVNIAKSLAQLHIIETVQNLH